MFDDLKEKVFIKAANVLEGISIPNPVSRILELGLSHQQRIILGVIKGRIDPLDILEGKGQFATLNSLQKIIAVLPAIDRKNLYNETTRGNKIVQLGNQEVSLNRCLGVDNAYRIGVIIKNYDSSENDSPAHRVLGTTCQFFSCVIPNKLSTLVIQTQDHYPSGMREPIGTFGTCWNTSEFDLKVAKQYFKGDIESILEEIKKIFKPS